VPSSSWSKQRPVALLDYHTDYLDPSNNSSEYRLGLAASAYGGKTWVRTPNWKEVKKSGILPENPYQFHKVYAAVGGSSAIRVTRKNDLGVIVQDYEDGTVGPDWYIYPGNTDLLDASVADARARNKVLNEVKNSTVNLGQVYGERAQTVLLVETTIQRVVKTVRYLRSGNWNAAANEVGVASSRNRHAGFSKRHSKNPQQAIADGWLELQYGWRPLLQDVYGSLEYVNNKQKRIVRQRVSKSASDNDRWGSGTEVTDLFTTYVDQKRKASVKYTLFYAAPNEFLKTLSEGGVTNPALVAWELLPWSFVVDWFLPVGNFISSWDATVGLEFQKGSKTTSHEVIHESTRSGRKKVEDSGKLVTAGISSLWRTYHSVHIQRSPSGAFPSPALPQFKNPVSPEHMANLLALLVGTFRNR